MKKGMYGEDIKNDSEIKDEVEVIIRYTNDNSVELKTHKNENKYSFDINIRDFEQEENTKEEFVKTNANSSSLFNQYEYKHSKYRNNEIVFRRSRGKSPSPISSIPPISNISTTATNFDQIKNKDESSKMNNMAKSTNSNFTTTNNMSKESSPKSKMVNLKRKLDEVDGK